MAIRLQQRATAFRASQTVADGRVYTEDVTYPKLVSGTEFSLIDEPGGSVNRDSMVLTMNALPETDLLQVEHYQVEVNDGTTTQIRDIDQGNAIHIPRYVMGRNDGTATPCRVRAVYAEKNVLQIDDPTNFAGKDGITVEGMTSGETATLFYSIDNEVSGATQNNNTEYHICVKGATGHFTPGEGLQDQANPGVELCKVGTWAFFISQCVVENCTEEIHPGQKLWVNNNVAGGGAKDYSFWVRHVEYISGTTGGGNWKARIYVYEEDADGDTQKVGDYLQAVTQPFNLGDTIYKSAANSDTTKGSSIGNIANQTLRPNFDYRHYMGGSPDLVKKAGPWSDTLNVTCTEGAPRITLTTLDGQGLVAGECHAPGSLQFIATAAGFSVLNPRQDLAWKHTSTDTWNFSSRIANEPHNVWATKGAADGAKQDVCYNPCEFTFGFITDGTHTINSWAVSKLNFNDSADVDLNVIVSDPLAGTYVWDEIAEVRPDNTGWSLTGSTHYTTLAAAVTAANSAEGKTTVIALDGSKTYDGDAGESWATIDQAKSVILMSIPGTGTANVNNLRAYIRTDADRLGHGGEVTIYNVDFDRGYRADSAFTGTPGDILFLSLARGTRQTLMASTLQGGHIHTKPAPGFKHRYFDPSVEGWNGLYGMSIIDVKMNDWGDFAIHNGDCGPTFHHGMALMQNPGALQDRAYSGSSGHRDIEGSATQYDWTVDHGCIRYSRMWGEYVFSMCFFRAIGGWGGGIANHQQALRLNEGGAPVFSITFDRVVEEGKPMSIELGTNPGKKQMSAAQVSLDAYFALNSQVASFRFSTGGMSISNMCMVVPDMRTVAEKDQSKGFQFGMDRTVGAWALWQDADEQPTRMNNCTLLDLRTGDTGDLVADKFINGEGTVFSAMDFYENLSEASNDPDNTTSSGNQNLKKLEVTNCLHHRPNDTRNGTLTQYCDDTDNWTAGGTPLDLTSLGAPGISTHQMYGCAQVRFNACNGYLGELKKQGTTNSSSSNRKTYIQYMQVTGGDTGTSTGTGWAMIESRHATDTNVATDSSLSVGDVITGENGNTFTITFIDIAQGGQLTGIAHDADGFQPAVPQAGSAANGKMLTGDNVIKEYFDIYKTVRANDTAGAFEGAIS